MRHPEKIKKSYLWRDVDSDIVLQFLSNFKVYSTDEFGLKSRMPIDFIIKYAEEINTLWDVAMYNGESNHEFIAGDISINQQKRKLEDKGVYYEFKNRSVSSGNAEGIVLDEEEKKSLKSSSDSKGIREKMKKPLLMLHIVNDQIKGEFGAFGVSFPGGVKSGNKTIKLKINSVYIQQLLDEEVYDD